MSLSRRTRYATGALAVALCAGVVAGCGGDGADPDAGPASESESSPLASPSGTARPTSSDSLPEWESFNTVEIPRDDFGTAVIGTDIWILGGMTGGRGTRLTSIEILDTTTAEWSLSDVEMPVGLASFESVAIGPRIYVFGGFDADFEASDWAGVLDTRSGKWTELPALPHARYAHTVTLHEGDIYVVGGEGNRAQQVAAIDVFDPQRGSWRTASATMPGPRNSHDTLSTPTGLLIMGGFTDDGPQKRVDLIDPVTGRTSEVPDLPRTISRGGAAIVDGQAWFSWHELTYVLDLAEPTAWQEGNPLTRSRHGLGYVPVGGWLYAIAGCSENPLRDVRTVDRLPLA